jgi:hypothetical protein
MKKKSVKIKKSGGRYYRDFGGMVQYMPRGWKPKKKKKNPVQHKTLTLSALSKGVRGLVKIRKVRNGIRVTVKR